MRAHAAIALLATCALPVAAQDWIGHAGMGAGIPVNGFVDDVKGGISVTAGISRMLGQHFMLGAYYKYNRYSLDDGKESTSLDGSSGSLQGRFLLVAPASDAVFPLSASAWKESTLSRRPSARSL